MKQTLALLLVASSIPTIWAQQPVRRRGHAASLAPLNASGRAVGSLQLGSRKAVKRNSAGKEASAPPPAPGVVQIHVEEGQVFAFFVATDTIPANSLVGGSITIDNGSELDFDSVQFTSDTNPGDFVILPAISNLGDLWPAGVVTYTVDVTINKVITEANGQFLSGESFAYADLANFAPIITGTSQRIGLNKDMILVITGVFTSDTPLVVLENAVPPASAITRISASEIDVDLSQVPGLDLTTLNEYLLTVSQAGYADTIVYRYAPAAPNTFNPAPQ